MFLTLWEARGNDTVRVVVGTEVTYLRYRPTVPMYVWYLGTLRTPCHTWCLWVWCGKAALAKQLENKQQGLRVNTAKVYFAFTPSALIMM